MLSDKIKTAHSIVHQLKDAGYIAYFAGGWVRDYLMHHLSDDIDIATKAPTEVVAKLFPRTVEIGIQFGIIVVIVNHLPFEIATFRTDLSYKNGRKPETIRYATAEEDAQRRDFTINGMFYDPTQSKILDFVDGKKDIEAKVIRTIGDPHERFREDRLRMIRAIRFSDRFSFSIDPATEKAIRSHASTLMPAVSIERVWQEFQKMARFSHLPQSLISLHRFGLLQTLFPELQTVNTETIKSRLAHTQFFPSDCPPILYLAQLFPKASLPQLITLCEYLKLGKREKRLLEYYHTFLTQAEKTLEKQEWVHLYAHPSFPLCLQVLSATKPEEKQLSWKQTHEKRQHTLAPHIKRHRDKTPLLTATQLKTEEIPPGRLMGQLLKDAEKIAIHEDLHTAQEVLTLLKKSPCWPKENA